MFTLIYGFPQAVFIIVCHYSVGSTNDSCCNRFYNVLVICKRNTKLAVSLSHTQQCPQQPGICYCWLALNVLCSWGWPWASDHPASTSQVLELQVSITVPSCLALVFLFKDLFLFFYVYDCFPVCMTCIGHVELNPELCPCQTCTLLNVLHSQPHLCICVSLFVYSLAFSSDWP